MIVSQGSRLEMALTYYQVKHFYFRNGYIEVCMVKAVLFPVVMYRCESLTIKKAEHQKLMLLNCVLEKTLKSPSDCKELKPVKPKGNQP